MAVSIYLSNNTVQIAIGDAGKNKVRIDKLYSLTIPEGSLLNGVITSEINLKNDLKQIWEKYQIPQKGVRLVLDSSRIMIKSVTVPKSNQKKMFIGLAEEFADTIQSDDYLFDGDVLCEVPGKKTEVLATAAEKEYIGDYVRLFNEIGISLESIDVSVNTELKIIKRLPQLEEGTVITSHLDGNNLVSTLLVDGHFKYFSRTRLFGEHGTESFASEVTRTVSSIMQFYSSQKYEKPLQNVYMGGYGREDYLLCQEAIERLGIHAAFVENPEGFVLPDSEKTVIQSELSGEPFRVCDYIYPIGALIQKKQDINLYSKYIKSHKTEKTGMTIKTAAPIIIVLGVCAVISAVLLTMNYLTERKVNEAEEFIGSPLHQKAYEEAMEKQAEAARIQSSLNEGKEIWEVIKSYPLPDTKVEQEILVCAGNEVAITVNSYDSETGVYGFTAKASDVTTINEFITRLRESSVFANLEYSGYTMEEDGAYLIMVDGFLNENAGK